MQNRQNRIANIKIIDDNSLKVYHNGNETIRNNKNGGWEE